MKMLAVYSAGTGKNARQAREGEPCVPNFGVCGRDLFVGLETDGLASSAVPKPFPDEQLDKLFGKYKERYPSLPEDLLEKYFLASAEAASKFGDGERVKISHGSGGKARLYSPESETALEVELE